MRGVGFVLGGDEPSSAPCGRSGARGARGGRAILLAVVVLGVAVSPALATSCTPARLDLRERAAADRPAERLRAGAADVSRGRSTSPAAPRLSTSRWSTAAAGSWRARSRSGRHASRSRRSSAAAIASGRTGYGEARLRGDERAHLRRAAGRPRRGRGAGGAVIVAASTAEIDRHARAVAPARSSLAALAAAALAAPPALLLTRRALRPLARLSAGAGVIERTGDASLRLRRRSRRRADEVGRLADTLNADARRARARPRGRAPLPRRRLARAAHPAHRAARQRRLPRSPRRRPPTRSPTSQADAARLSRLLDDLLALAREDAARPCPTSPSTLDELARGTAAATHAVVVDADGPALVRGDRARARARGREPGRERAAPRPAGGPVRVRPSDDGRVVIAVDRRGRGHPAAIRGARRPSRFWRGPDAEAAGLRARPGARPRDRRAARRRPRHRRAALRDRSCPLSEISQTIGAYNFGRRHEGDSREPPAPSIHSPASPDRRHPGRRRRRARRASRVASRAAAPSRPSRSLAAAIHHALAAPDRWPASPPAITLHQPPLPLRRAPRHELAAAGRRHRPAVG